MACSRIPSAPPKMQAEAVSGLVCGTHIPRDAEIREGQTPSWRRLCPVQPTHGLPSEGAIVAATYPDHPPGFWQAALALFDCRTLTSGGRGRERGTRAGRCELRDGACACQPMRRNMGP